MTSGQYLLMLVLPTTFSLSAGHRQNKRNTNLRMEMSMKEITTKVLKIRTPKITVSPNKTCHRDRTAHLTAPCPSHKKL